MHWNTDELAGTIRAEMGGHPPVVVTRGGCYTLDEKMGQTYIHYECANTLAQRDYKQPQAVIYGCDRMDCRPPYPEDP